MEPRQQCPLNGRKIRIVLCALTAILLVMFCISNAFLFRSSLLFGQYTFPSGDKVRVLSPAEIAEGKTDVHPAFNVVDPSRKPQYFWGWWDYPEAEGAVLCKAKVLKVFDLALLPANKTYSSYFSVALLWIDEVILNQDQTAIRDHQIVTVYSTDSSMYTYYSSPPLVKGDSFYLTLEPISILSKGSISLGYADDSYINNSTEMVQWLQKSCAYRVPAGYINRWPIIDGEVYSFDGVVGEGWLKHIAFYDIRITDEEVFRSKLYEICEKMEGDRK